MQLSEFIRLFEENKGHQRLRQESFQVAVANLGDDFLCKPLNPGRISTYYRRFLVESNSYGREIDWQELATAWGPAQQQIAAELRDSNLEEASDSELSIAAGLFNHLIKSAIAGLWITNISELLALGLPSICMAWDNKIMNDFKKKHPLRPAYKHIIHTTYHHFLFHARGELEDLISQAQAANNQSRDEAVTWLRELPMRINDQGRARPLAKLLGDYYWLHIYRKPSF